MACIFCRIISGDAPGSFAHRDESVVAFMDLFPATPGHLLVVPVAHATHLADLPESTGAHMFEVAQRMAAALRESEFATEGINLFLADGEAAGQEVPHTHLHVIPRFSGDGFMIRPSYGVPPTREALDDHAATLSRIAASE